MPRDKRESTTTAQTIQADHLNEIAELDKLITRECLENTMGRVCIRREGCWCTGGSARTYWVDSMIFNAVFDMDIGLIENIVHRIDGATPDSSERSQYANHFGSALEEVMTLTLGPRGTSGEMAVLPTDSPILAIAKVTYYLSIQECRNNQMKRKDRQQAAKLISKSMAGRRTKPTKNKLTTTYEDPDWMQALGDGHIVDINPSEE
jgi:hypothetical protein